MEQAIKSHHQRIIEALKKLPEDKLIEVEDFIGFLKEKYIDELIEEPKDFKLEEKDFITSPEEERKGLEKTGKYSKDFLDQFEKNIAKSSIYSRKS
jgi:hypothetical protein